MENLKIRVNNADESKEAQELFFKLGGSWAGYKNIHDWPEIKQLYLDENYITFSNDINFFVNDPSKELTLPELRAMANPVKEYLDKKPDGSYELIVSNGGCIDRDWIEIPEGAIKFLFRKQNGSNYHFANENNKLMSLTDIHCGKPYWYGNAKNYMNQCKVDVLWQRDQDEPFLTPETTLNDQYAEIEKVRQHSHYFKDVSGLNEIDVYMVLKLFNVTDPCLQHIAKKALCAGQRGHKDFKKDLQDILDTAKRAVEINNG